METKIIVDLKSLIGCSHVGSKPIANNALKRYEIEKEIGKVLKGLPDDAVIVYEEFSKDETYPIYRTQIDNIVNKISAFEVYETKSASQAIAAILQETDKEFRVKTGNRIMTSYVSDYCTVELYDINFMCKTIHTQNFKEEFGVDPANYIDLLSILGDELQSVKRVPVIHKKDARKLISDYSNIESLLASINSIEDDKMQQHLLAYKKQIEDNKQQLTHKTKPQKATIHQKDNSKFTYQEPESLEDSLLKKYLSINYETLNEITYLPNQCVLHAEIPDTGYRKAEIDGFAIAADKNYFVPLEVAQKSEVFKRWLSNSDVKKTVFNSKSLHVCLDKYGLKVDGIESDISLMDYCLKRDAGISDIFKLCTKHGVEILTNKVKTSLPKNDPVHLLHKAVALQRLEERMTEKLEQKDVLENYNETLAASNIFANQEIVGIPIDIALAEKSIVEIQHEIEKVENEIYKLANRKFNILEELEKVLFDEMKLNPPPKQAKKSKKSTLKKEDLIKMLPQHKIIEKRITHMDLKRLLQEHKNIVRFTEKERVHPENNMFSKTGRISTSNPNVQGLTKGSVLSFCVLDLIISESDSEILTCDYSENEIRLLSHISGDQKMIDEINSNDDLYLKNVKGIDETFDSTELRAKGKQMMIPTFYGAGIKELASRTGFSKEQIKAYQIHLNNTYVAFDKFKGQFIIDTKEELEVKTLRGSICNADEIIHSPYKGRNAVLNKLIQGSAADVLKASVIKLEKKFTEGGLKSRILFTKHDEIVFNVKNDELAMVKNIVSDCMCNHDLSVKLKVKMKMGTTLNL